MHITSNDIGRYLRDFFASSSVWDRQGCLTSENLYSQKINFGSMAAINIGHPTPLKKQTLLRYLTLPQPADKIQCTYVWPNKNADMMSAKSRTLDFAPCSPTDIPTWAFCGFPHYPGVPPTDSDLYLHPVALYKDPFRQGDNKLVLCDTYDQNNIPTEFNKRNSCLEVMRKVKGEEPWFGIEQEYTLLDQQKHLLGVPKVDYAPPSDIYCYSIGIDRVSGRDIAEAHYRACLYAGIKIAGINVELMPAQFEFQIGPSTGIDVSDDLWMARFILLRIVEDFGVLATFDPKPVPGGWLGCGAHTNFSTKKMRDENGLGEIESAIERLRKRHNFHLQCYDPNRGKDNARRMTGMDGAPNPHFTSAVADRNASVRIPRMVAKERKGYLEDRRPAANCDPYSVCELIVQTVCLND